MTAAVASLRLELVPFTSTCRSAGGYDLHNITVAFTGRNACFKLLRDAFQPHCKATSARKFADHVHLLVTGCIEDPHRILCRLVNGPCHFVLPVAGLTQPLLFKGAEVIELFRLVKFADHRTAPAVITSILSSYQQQHDYRSPINRIVEEGPDYDEAVWERVTAKLKPVLPTAYQPQPPVSILFEIEEAA